MSMGRTGWVEHGLVTYRASSFSADKNYLGRSQFGDPLFDGALDDLWLYNRAFTTDEVKALAKGGAPPPNGVVLGYNFDETRGTTAGDVSGNSKDAQVINGISVGAGKLGTALQLDGAAGYVRLPSDPLSALGDFTVACFVNQTAVVSSARIFDFGSDSGNYITLMANAVSSQRMRFATIVLGGGSGQYLRHRRAHGRVVAARGRDSRR